MTLAWKPVSEEDYKRFERSFLSPIEIAILDQRQEFSKKDTEGDGEGGYLSEDDYHMAYNEARTDRDNHRLDDLESECLCRDCEEDF